jgi:hypothetical protein
VLEENDMQTYKFLLIGVASMSLGVLTAGCAPNDYGALSEYNDLWKGALSFDNGTSVNAALRIFVTQWDEELARSEGDLCMGLYGALELAGGDVVVAGPGEASHWDGRTLEGLYSPIEGREFVSVAFYEPYTTGLAESPDYADDYGEFLAVSGASDVDLRGRVEIIVERDGDSMTGIVTETGGPGYEEIVGEGVTQLFTRQIGTVSFHRIGDDVEATFPDENTVRREPFEYETVVYSINNWGYDIRTLH